MYSLNVGGLSTKYNLGLIDRIFKESDIICLSETKTNYYENFPFENFKAISMPIKNEKYKFGGAHGLCIYVRDEVFDKIQILTDETVTECMLWVKLSIKSSTFSFYLGAVYVPHEKSNYFKNDIFDNIIFDVATLKSKTDLPFIILGDFNSRTGELDDFMEICPELKEYFELEIDDNAKELFQKYHIPLKRKNEDRVVNKNGINLIDLCKATDLKIMNGRMGQDKNIGKFTCTTGMGNSSIDYALISPKIIPIVEDFIVDDFERGLSDSHSGLRLNIVLSDDKLNQRTAWENHTNKCDINHLHFSINWDNEKRDQFTSNFNETEISKLCDHIDEFSPQNVNAHAIENIASEFKNLILDSARETGLYKETKASKLTYKKTQNHRPWFDIECKIARNDYIKFKNKYKKFNHDEARNLIKRRFLDYKGLIKRKKNEYRDQLSVRLRDDVKNNPGEFWKIIKGKHNNREKIDLATFKEHFENLNRCENSETDGMIDSDAQHYIENEDINGLFTIQEVKRQISRLKNSKASGLDRITNECLKNSPESFIKLIAKIFNLILTTGIVPEEWCIGMIQPIFKKGDDKNPDNYRGITLISCIGKLFTSCINNRLTLYLESSGALNENQAGFRDGYSTLDHIYTLHSIIEFYLHRKEKIYACFVDYRKAFDLIDRTALWSKLLSKNINGRIFNIIRNIYAQAKSCVKSGSKISGFFACKVGVRQGDNLSPLLFSLYLSDFQDFLARHYNGLNILSNEIAEILSNDEIDMYLRLYVLLYADDTIILAETEDELQKALIALEEYCSIWHLQVNLDKTKIIIFSRVMIRKHMTFKFGGKIVEVVPEYIYLGVTMGYNNRFTKAIEKQQSLARKAFFAMISRVENLQLPLDLQLELYNKLVLPVLLYGCEIWGHDNLEKMESLHRKFLNYILKTSKYTAKAMVYGESGQRELKITIKTRILNFWHRLSVGSNKKISVILFNLMKSLYQTNTLKSRWLKNVENILNEISLSFLFNFNGVNGGQLKSAVNLRLTDAFNQNWNSEINNNNLCLNYRLFKTEFGLEKYSNILDNNLRVTFTKFRCGSHCLPVRDKRYLGLNDRNICPLCDLDIGDEYHYVMTCPALSTQRSNHIPHCYTSSPNVLKFRELMSCTHKPTLIKLAKFIKFIMYVFRL